MHLVVLRRNNIALPKQLPASLDPLSMVTTQQETEDQLVEPAGTSQHWTKFVDSPTGSIASPGPQPVNFDFKRAQVEQDPRILHPVALRVTPESQSVDLSSSSCPVSLPPVTTSNTLNNPLTNILTTPGGKKEPPPPPPPRPYRGHNRSSSLDLNQLGNFRLFSFEEDQFHSARCLFLRGPKFESNSTSTSCTSSSITQYGMFSSSRIFLLLTRR